MPVEPFATSPWLSQQGKRKGCKLTTALPGWEMGLLWREDGAQKPRLHPLPFKQRTRPSGLDAKTRLCVLQSQTLRVGETTLFFIFIFLIHFYC